MPLPGPASTSLDPAVDSEPPINQYGENLSGWAAIERHLYKHDGGEMKYYAEDIDTLLVFAGLFSAFLTAFVVQTYPMLTEADSTTTNQLLALSVSAQLRTTGIIAPSAINATLVSLLDAPAFAPTAAARVINIFFFLSLVLSLSSALFGILAKQWIREYLRWNSPLALPRENVLVRQARVEEWEAWNVGATISSIPALLESAMVLFLMGIVVLLWTLDDVVAITITIFASLFLFAAAAFTVLPVFLTRCPYKSPTAWACVVMSRALNRTYMAFLSLLRRLCEPREYILNFESPAAPSTWREMDLSGCRAVRGKFDGRVVQRRTVKAAVADHVTSSWTIPHEGQESILLNVIETALLLRALAWVKQSSQDPRIAAHITQCAASIHLIDPRFPTPLTIASNLVANRCVYTSLRRHSAHRAYAELLYEPPSTNELHDEPSDHWSIVTPTTQHPRISFLQMLATTPRFGPGVDWSMVQVLGQITVADLQYTLNQPEEVVNLVVIRELGSMIDFMRFLGRPSGVDIWEDEEWYQTGLHLMVQFTNRIQKWDESNSDLCCRTVMVAMRSGRLRATPDHKLIYMTGSTTVQDVKSLLLDYMIEDPAVASNACLLMFMHVFDRWHRDRIPGTHVAEPDPALLDKASWFIAYALSCRTPVVRRQAFTWLLNWIDRDDGLVVTLINRHRSPQFRQLMHAAERNFSERELEAGGLREIHGLHAILQLAHTDLPACEEPACRWISHECDARFLMCSIFGDIINRHQLCDPSCGCQRASPRAWVPNGGVPARKILHRMRETWNHVTKPRTHSGHTRDSTDTTSEIDLEGGTRTPDGVALGVIREITSEAVDGPEGSDTV